MGNELMKTMALYYASLGLRVVPIHGVYGSTCTCNNPACRSPAKHPRTQNGLRDGSKDVAVVERMWTRWPFASIGICTGIESGVLVIDYDGDHAALQEAPEFFRRWFNDKMPPTWRATTGGGGKHVFFRYDGEGGIQSRSRIWAHSTKRRDGSPVAAVDVRADGGYVVGAPSPHISGRSYAWDEGCAPADTQLATLPDELEQFLRRNFGGAIAAPSGDAGAARFTTGAGGAVPKPGELPLHADQVTQIKAALSYIDATERDTWLHVGMALRSTGAGQQAYDIWTEWSLTKPHKFDAADQERTWKGLRELLPSGEEITLRKLFWLAKQHGAPDFEIVDVQIAEPTLPFADAPPEPEELPENDPGPAAEPVPSVAVEALFADFWPRLRQRSPLIHEVVEWISKTAPKKQPLLAFGNVLAAIGALLGRRVRSPGNTRTNLYVFGIAPSGRGKEHSRQCVAQLFTAAGLTHWIGADKWKSDSGIRTELLKAPAHLAQIDEFGKVLAQIASPHAPSHLAGIVQTLLELTGRAGGVDLGPAYADQKTRPREVIVEPCLSLYATAVPNDVFDSLSSRSVADGFLNRWICLFGDDRPPIEESEDASYRPPQHIVEALQLLEQNWRTQPSPSGPQLNMPSMAAAAHVIPRTPDASERRREIGRAIEATSVEKERRGDTLADLWARVPELTERVALVFAATRPVTFERRDGAVVTRWEGKPAAAAGKDRDGFPVDAYVPSSIERADMDLAHDLVAWSFRRFEAAVEVRVADSEYEAKLKRVLRTIIAAGTKGLTQSEFTRKTQWLSSRDRDDVAKTLADSKQIVVTMVPKTEGKAGPSAALYRFSGFMPGKLQTPQERFKPAEQSASEDCEVA